MTHDWQRVLRTGFFPQWTLKHLHSLEYALENDAPHLEQGCTTYPPPLTCMADAPCEKACLIAFPFWDADELETVGEVESAFAAAAYKADLLTGECGSVRHLTELWDDNPRDRTRALVLHEIRMELERRRTPATIREQHDAETLSLPPP